jgi:serine/threonine protein kinase
MKTVTTMGPGVMRGARRVSAPEFHQAHVQQELTIDDFTLVDLLGQGGVGNVWYAVKQDTQHIFAVKIIDKHHVIGSISVGRVLAEREIMTMLEHPFVITLHFAFQDDTRVFFVLDYLSGGDFFRLLEQIPDRRMSEEAAMFYAAEIMLALEYLHQNNICFRDLKPENILLSAEGHIRVTDFGLASWGSKRNLVLPPLRGGRAAKTDITVDTTHKTVCGTPEYMAPEVIREEGHGRPVDYWALGVIIYEMIVGKTPWAEMNATDSVRMLATRLFISVLSKPVPFPKFVSNSAKHLIEGLMSKDPNTRMGVNGADEVKNHPFFKTVNWRKIGAEQCKPPFIPEVKNPQSDPGYKSMDEFKQHFKPYCSPKHTPIAQLVAPPEVYPKQSDDVLEEMVSMVSMVSMEYGCGVYSVYSVYGV